MERPEEWKKSKPSDASQTIPVIKEEEKGTPDDQQENTGVAPELVEIQKILDDALAEPAIVYDAPAAKDYEEE